MGNESLRYDAQGKSLDQGQEGDWTVYGAVRIQKIELGKKQIRLQGTRLVFEARQTGWLRLNSHAPKISAGSTGQAIVNVEIKNRSAACYRRPGAGSSGKCVCVE